MTTEKEVKSVLMGRMLPTEDGRLSSIPKNDFRLPIGISDGAGAVRFFGLARKARRLDTKEPRLSVMAAVPKAMQNIGRALILQELPYVRACFIRYVMTRPVVITLEYEGEVPYVTAWAGRGISGLISINRALKALAGELPGSIRLSEEEPPKPAKKKREKKKKQPEESMQVPPQDAAAAGPEPEGPAPQETPIPEEEPKNENVSVQEVTGI
ncbi:MAG: hypothetical protein II974_06155 [Firmicutes bacterium]|nr:hypothetical protein [Bacillota bacterium]